MSGDFDQDSTRRWGVRHFEKDTEVPNVLASDLKIGSSIVYSDEILSHLRASV